MGPQRKTSRPRLGTSSLRLPSVCPVMFCRRPSSTTPGSSADTREAIVTLTVTLPHDSSKIQVQVGAHPSYLVCAGLKGSLSDTDHL